ncbi:MAG: rane protein of unknown function [Modestobacter sp.]|nr:rane protein of unknown function [Modestobacter sp.]MCW2676835.1 rane protein of unknown function [Modestobacter sp.]
MPSSSARARAGAGGPGRPAPRRPLGRGFTTAPAVPERPLPAPFAALFGLLVAAEDLYLTWLLWVPERRWEWYLAVPVLLAGWAVAGAVLVFRGRGRGALVLAGAAVLPLAGILVLTVVLGLLGGGTAMWSSLLLLVGPVGCLALTLRRPVREWTRSAGSARRGRRRERPAR